MPIPADISELRKSFHRSFLATVRQFEERVGVGQYAPPPPRPPAIPPTGIADVGVPEREFTGDPGFTTPPSLSALQSLGALGQTTAWTGGAFITLGDRSTAWCSCSKPPASISALTWRHPGRN